MKKTGRIKECLICKKEFYAPRWLERKNGAKYCSYSCYYESKKGKPSWNKGTKGSIKKNSGSFIKGNNKFIGELKEYKSLHYWIRKKLGSSKKCSRCGTVGKIEWANKSGKYKKVTSDWIALCSSCHFIYDKTERRRSKWN